MIATGSDSPAVSEFISSKGTGVLKALRDGNSNSAVEKLKAALEGYTKPKETRPLPGYALVVVPDATSDGKKFLQFKCRKDGDSVKIFEIVGR